MQLHHIFRSTLPVRASSLSRRVPALTMPLLLPPSSSPCPVWSTPGSNRSSTRWQGRVARWWRRRTCHSWTRSPAASPSRKRQSVRASWTFLPEVQLQQDGRETCSLRRTTGTWTMSNRLRRPLTPAGLCPSPPQVPSLLTSPSPLQSLQRPPN